MVEYTLRAQFVPSEATKKAHTVVDKKWPKKFKDISAFRGSRKIYIYRPLIVPKVLNFKYDVRTEVGGVFGIGASKSISIITFPRNEFYPGDEIEVKINCDNSRCGKAIKTFKFKIYRQLICRDAVTKNFKISEEKLCT